MMRKGRAIVTEFFVSPAKALFALDLWDAADIVPGDIVLPGPGRALLGAGGAVLRVGPRRWWLDGAGLFADEALAGRGVLTEIGGGWARVRLVGDWRDLVMQSGLFDAEAPAFDPGAVAVTPLCHAPCVLHVRAQTWCEVFIAASHVAHCLAHWRELGWQQGVGT